MATILTKAQCVECSRVFDLLDEDDSNEWAYGHDCEAQMTYTELSLITCDTCDKTVSSFKITTTEHTHPYSTRLCLNCPEED